ncbi:hypothetical protein RhiirC2_793825 [Rhizophagus irregularis]|uniref:Uncharacterized protein n=1 Tax=Rhizophagus irregularis TaxID=588596 RepID=A0A2N1MEM5_9GLOM|nr:hypothetical protein RhiirC2_793825 [Rhizophagus irregularis]
MECVKKNFRKIFGFRESEPYSLKAFKLSLIILSLLLLALLTVVRIIDNKSVTRVELREDGKVTPNKTNFNSSLLVKDIVVRSSQSYYVRFRKKIVQRIIPSWMDCLRFPPKYIGTGLVTGDVALTLTAGTSDTEFNSEVRVYTLFGILGTLGGVWSLMLIVYAFLFGMKRIEPWGLIHKYGWCFASRTKIKLRKELKKIPFINQSNLNNESKIEERLYSLENFLRENVINVELLDNMNNNDNDKKTSL